MTGVIDACVGLTISLDETGFQLLTSEIVGSANWGLQALSQGMASDMSFDQIRAVNSGRCALLNMADNAWNFLAATYFTVKALATPTDLKRFEGLIETYYPYVCTCKMETDYFSTLIGGNEETAVIMSACSEKA